MILWPRSTTSSSTIPPTGFAILPRRARLRTVSSTRGRSSRFSRAIWRGSIRFTTSLASRGGVWPAGWRGFPTTSRSGVDQPRARASQLRESNSASPTNATCGRRCFGSSKPSARRSSSGNRSPPPSGSAGWTRSSAIWSRSVIEPPRWFSLLQPWAHRTSAPASSGVPVKE